MVDNSEDSIFHSSLPLSTKLERARMELLDLSTRNRLLHVPRFSKGAKTIDVVDEKSVEVFRLLVKENKPLTFLPGRRNATAADGSEDLEDDELSDVDLALPEDDLPNEQGVFVRHADTKLQTRMTAKGLQKRLLDLYYDARTLEEEQGVNILFLALGTLNWIDPNKKDSVRHAPLILVPVILERGTAGERFRLRLRPEDLLSNLSLEAYLDRVHGLRLPAFDGSEEFDPAAYFEAVATSISTQPDWQVAPDNIVLGFFSFAKFLMYRDLDAQNWPSESRLVDQAMVRALLVDGFRTGASLIPEDGSLDAHISPGEMLHIVDSDSSQTSAVHEVRNGRALVIQGPPGTGKSQTIANVIASAVADGKTVLFVAEKMAALDVVKRRLDQAGVGDACLELHSNKANKRVLLDELRRTWELGSPRGEFPSSLVPNLTNARDMLNGHASRMHAPHSPSALTPYQVFGHLTRLRQQGQKPTDVKLEGATTWSPDDVTLRLQLLSELAQRIDDIGLPAQHPWHGIALEMVLPTQIERWVPRLKSLHQRIETLSVDQESLSAQLHMTTEFNAFGKFPLIKARADILADAPNFSPKALRSEVWIERATEVRSLLNLGKEFAATSVELNPLFTETALNKPIDGLQAALSKLPADMSAGAFEKARRLSDLLPDLKSNAATLNTELGSVATCLSLSDIEKVIITGERVAAAPDASPDAFAATVWDHGVEQAADLVEAVVTLENARAQVGTELLDVAWQTDVKTARQALAVHTGLLRYLSGDWRRANALLRSIATNPALSAAEAVKLLDTLMRGQAAAARIKEGDSFGRSAFGADWRGERSSSGPLLALVNWMRTLRGLGAEPRLIASKLTHRTAVNDRSAQSRKLFDKARPLLAELWSELGASASLTFSNASSADRTEMEVLAQGLTSLIWMNDLVRDVMRLPPDRVSDRLKLVRKLVMWQRLARAIDDKQDLAASAFDESWKGRFSDWTQLCGGAEWIARHSDLRSLAAEIADRQELARRARQASAEANSLATDLTALLQELQTDAEKLFDAQKLDDVKVTDTSKKIASWLLNTEQLSKWVIYQNRSSKARSAGMGMIVDQMTDGNLATNAAQSTFEIAYYEALLTDLVRMNPDLGRFDGRIHDQLVQEFSRLDHQQMKAARLEVVRAHHRRIPAKDGGVGPVGMLRTEMAKRRGHVPIRQLMQKAGPAVQAIKPVLMMSPLSVAQFLPPGRMNFDLLVMDEASQIQPVDALGAIARCKQLVVVGDERQLPPTKFFAKMTGSQPDDGDGDDGVPVADIESILGLCIARGMPQRMLRWHYRSRHQSLIAISNREFYENKLFIVPSPYTQEAGMGLRFQHIPDGVFDSGGTGTNAVEARYVAQAIIQHAKANADLSLGVATFSVAQRKAIQDELELLRRLNPDTEEFFHSHPSEPFFVKNLENIQGDERDVIMISVGYAKNAQGNFAMRFGPLGSEGGERRLNVLISRAKRRCEVFASITDEDIDLDRAKGRGVIAFKLFLQYARTGRLSVAQPTGKSIDGVFEEQVASALQTMGYQVHPQVGIAGLFIDLAIADVDRPGRYILGIECDGTSYHSSRSARDRDRLGRSVLEDHGWIMHRIWSTDWFQRPQEELDRAIAAIEAARAELDARLESGPQRQRAVPVEIVTVDRGDVVEIGLADTGRGETSSHVYIEAVPARAGSYELHETPVGVMAELVEQVVRIESPVHVDEIVVRLRTAWGLQRAGVRIESAVKEGINLAVNSGRIEWNGAVGSFLALPGIEPQPRDRGQVGSPGLRKLEMISTREIAAGVAKVISSNLGATEEEIVMSVSRMLGFKATSAGLRRGICDVVVDLVTEGRLRREDKMLFSSAPAT